MIAQPVLDKTSPRGQVEIVLRLLDGRQFPCDSPVFAKTLEWCKYVTNELHDLELESRLVDAACKAFQLTKADLYIQISGVEVKLAAPQGLVVDTDAELEAILPQGGWFEHYATLTRQTESPLSYHTFSSLCVLGAALGRRVYIKMGFFNIYPNFCAVLIGPTGRVKKTSATDIAKEFIHKAALCPIMADAITPEALATALVRDGGQQFVYAPEFAVLFNRQKYNEALTTRIIRLLDCPETFTVETQARAREDITNIALTFLGCSTPSLFTGATPEMVTSSGFLNRFILVVEEDTNREQCIPARGDEKHAVSLYQTLSRMKKLSGEVVLPPTGQAFKLYKDWYHERKMVLRRVPDEITAEVMERGSSHMLRMAMLVHIAEHGDSCVCEGCVRTAINMLNFVEKKTPGVVRFIRNAAKDADGDRLLGLIVRMGGAADHSNLLRRSRLDATTFKRAITTLTESRRIRSEKRGAMQLYILNQGGEEDAGS